MPNHVRNVLKFKYLSEDDKQFILENFTVRISGLYPLNRTIGFNKIRPEPEDIKSCPEKYILPKDEQTDFMDRPWFDWYNWHMDFWGTKWDAYDGYVKLTKNTITFVFTTAWAYPSNLYNYLYKTYPLFFWEAAYADEDIGANCGRIVYDPSRTSFTAPCFYDCEGNRAFAERIWKK